MTDSTAAALAAGLAAPETELHPWDSLPVDERQCLQRAIVSSNAPRYLVTPTTQAGLAAAIAAAAAEGLWVLPYGRGSKLDWGGLLREIDLLASTRNLNRIVDHAVGDLTITVEAGVKLADIQAHLATHRQFLPLDPSYPETATIGGILATADAGSWRHRYGGVRDLVLGITVVRPDGQVAKAGGRVVKNVAGYDLMKLFVGSYGTLGTIAEVTLRAYALDEASATVAASGSLEDVTVASGQLRAATVTPTIADLLSPAAFPDGDGHSLVVRFQGATAGVKEQLARFSAIAEATCLKSGIYRDGDERNLWQQLQAIARAPFAPGILGAKFGLRPTAAPQLLAALAPLEAPAIVHLGVGLGRVAFREDPDRVRELRALCEGHGGFLTVLAASKTLKANVDPWGYSGNSLEMMRRLKQRFDPQNIFSPGRFVGNL